MLAENTALAAILLLRADDGPDAARNAVEEIRQRLHEGSSDAHRAKALDILGSYYSPTANGLLVSTWLASIAALLSPGDA